MKDMEFVKKETVVTITDTDGNTIKKNDVVSVEASGKCYIGEFLGFGSRGSLRFRSVLSEKEFAISPKAITSMKFTEFA